MKILVYLILQLCLISSLHAGDRGCVIGISDITRSQPTKESKRLFELLQMDVVELFTKTPDHKFTWRQDGSKITTVKSNFLHGVFQPMIITNKKAGLVKVIEQQKLSDGLIVFEYDHQSMHARLKLFDRDGSELALIKLPLEKDGAMKHSLFKHVRRASLTALGSYVRFVP
jgi:hypothetical protein